MDNMFFHAARRTNSSYRVPPTTNPSPIATNQLKAMEDNIIPFEQPESNSRRPGSLMKSDLVEKAAEIIPDPKLLINVVSKRVAQLNSGRSPLIKALPSWGAADIALTEIIEGKIRVKQENTEAAEG